MKKKFLVFSFIAFFALVLSACGANNDTGNNVEGQTVANVSNNDEVIFLQHADPPSLDPQASNDLVTAEISRQIFEGLVTFDENANVVPLLAESFYMLEDGTWEFTIRQGIYFHDGSYLNAEAVARSILRLIDPANAAPAAFILGMLEDVIPVDTYTVHMVTSFPFAALPSHFTHNGSFIISPLSIEEEENGGVTVNEHPVGTGPFRFVSRSHGHEVVMERNDEHWNGAPSIQRLRFLVVPESSTRISMMEAGEAHAVIAGPQDIEVVQAIPDLDLINILANRIYYLGFNTSATPFDNVLVRQAVAHVINRDDVLIVAEGQGIPAVGPLPPNVIGAPTNLIPHPHDVERAIELMAEAGFENGFSTTLYINSGEPIMEMLAGLIQSKVAQIGIDVSIEMLEWGSFLDLLGHGQYSGMFLLTWTTVSGDADYGLYPQFHSSTHGLAGNLVFYSNIIVDNLLDEARQSPDQNIRNQLYAEVSQILVDEAPMITLFYPTVTFVTRGIDGIFVDNNVMPYFHRVVLRD